MGSISQAAAQGRQAALRATGQQAARLGCRVPRAWAAAWAWAYPCGMGRVWAPMGTRARLAWPRHCIDSPFDNHLARTREGAPSPLHGHGHAGRCTPRGAAPRPGPARPARPVASTLGSTERSLLGPGRAGPPGPPARPPAELTGDPGPSLAAPMSSPHRVTCPVCRGCASLAAYVDAVGVMRDRCPQPCRIVPSTVPNHRYRINGAESCRIVPNVVH